MAHTTTTIFRTVLSVLLFCTLAGTAVAIDLPSIVVDKLEDDFGDVHVGRKVEKRIAVTNKGTAPLAIEYIETTCGCTKAIAENLRINPGEKTDVVVSYDTVGLGWGRSTQAVRINTNDPKRPVVSVKFFANILHEVVLDPQNLVTKLPEIENPLTFSVLAKNRSDKPIVLQLLKTRGAIAKAVFKPEMVKIAPNAEERFSIEVVLSDEKKRPSYRGAVFVATDHAEEKEIILPCLIKIAQKRCAVPDGFVDALQTEPGAWRQQGLPICYHCWFPTSFLLDRAVSADYCARHSWFRLLSCGRGILP